jgi:hypothetical protein
MSQWSCSIGGHRIERPLDSQPDVFALIPFDCGRNQSVTERFEQPPIASFVHGRPVLARKGNHFISAR